MRQQVGTDEYIRGFGKMVCWDIDHQPIKMQAGNTDMIESDYKYDPRVVWIEDRMFGLHGVMAIMDLLLG